MKSLKFLSLPLSVIFLILAAGCNNNNSSSNSNTNDLVGKTYYILDGEISSGYYPTLKEIEMHFISDNLIEERVTMYADITGYKAYSESDSDHTTIIKYSYKDGILQLPSANLIIKLETLNNGNLKSNTGEYFYQTSIVKMLGTRYAKQRILESPLQMPDVFVNIISKKSEPLITEKNGMIEFSQDTQSKSYKKQKDDLEMEYNDILAILDSMQENDNTFSNNNEDVLYKINQLKEKIRTELSQDNVNGVKAKEDITKFKQLINSLIKPIPAYTKDTIEYINKPKAIFHGGHNVQLKDSVE